MVIEIIKKGTSEMRKYIFVAALAITILSLQACVKEKTVQKDVPATVTQPAASTTPQAEATTPAISVSVTQPTASAAPQVAKTPIVTTTETIKPVQTTASAAVAQSNPTSTKQPVTTATTKTTTPPQTTASTKGNLTNGATVYKKNCAGCHGNTGEGNGPAASSLKPKPANFVATSYKDSKGKNPRDYTDAEILDIINNGRKGTAMPAWKKQLSAEQINDVLAYVRSLEK